MDDYYLIAEIEDIYSTDGSVIIKSFSDFSKRFFELEKVFFDFFGKVKELNIESVEKIENTLIMKFRRFDSEEDVLFLIGKKLYVDEDNLYKLPADTYYIHDLVGSEIYINSEFFGKMVDVLKLQSNDVYVIQKDDGKEIMIPAVEEFVEKIMLEKNKIFLDPKCVMFDDDEN